MNTFVIALLVLACTVAGLFVFAGAVEIYFSRKEKFFIKQIQIITSILERGANMMLKQVNDKKKEESK